MPQVMVRRSTPQQTLADRYFPVRVRVAVPPGGFGSQFNHMHAWLDHHVGPGRYFTGAQARVRTVDAAVFYFVDANVAAQFVERFACGLVTGTDPPTG